MEMEVIIRATKWVVGGEKLQGGPHLPPIRAFMDVMTTMKRSLSIVKGKVVDKKFAINE